MVVAMLRFGWLRMQFRKKIHFLFFVFVLMSLFVFILHSDCVDECCAKCSIFALCSTNDLQHILCADGECEMSATFEPDDDGEKREYRKKGNRKFLTRLNAIISNCKCIFAATNIYDNNCILQLLTRLNYYDIEYRRTMYRTYSKTAKRNYFTAADEAIMLHSAFMSMWMWMEDDSVSSRSAAPRIVINIVAVETVRLHLCWALLPAAAIKSNCKTLKEMTMLPLQSQLGLCGLCSMFIFHSINWIEHHFFCVLCLSE